MSKKSQLLELIMNCFCGMIDQQKAFFYIFFEGLFPSRTIVRDSHRRKYPVFHE